MSDGQLKSWGCRSKVQKRVQTTGRDLGVISIEMETEVMKGKGTIQGECVG